jgi:anaerobic magnesium-protoporphyrin IX monomethyl ester cyclase
MKIVLLFPPGASFEQPYLSLPSLTAFLRQNGYDVIQRDINIEAFLFFLNTSRLKKSCQTVGETLKRMEKLNKLQHYHDIDKYTRLVKSKLLASYIIENIEEAVSIFRDEKKFFDLWQYKWAKEIVEGALELISCQYYPNQWSIDAYTLRYSRFCSEDILKAVCDESTNIFLDFFRRNIMPSVLKEKPSLVGISITYTNQIIPAFTLARLIKKADTNIHVTVGGALIPYFSDNLKTDKKIFSIVDSFIIFEGEHALLQLARQLKCRGDLSKVPNIIYYSKKRTHFYKSIFIEDINSLPPPCFDGLPLNAYFSPALVLPLEISRGCYWNKCVFCTVSAATRLSYRRKNPLLIIKEIRRLSARYKTRYFFFSVDVAAPDELVNLSEQLRKNNIRIYWQCEARLEKGFTQEVCNSIAKSGCRQLIFGLESASQKVLDLMKKGTKVVNFKRILQNCCRNNIAVNLQYFFGFPGETLWDKRKTIQFISDNRSLITSVCRGRFRLNKGSKMCANPLRYGITKIFTNPMHGFSVFYNFKVKSKVKPQESFSNDVKFPADYDWLGIPYNAHSLLFFTHYNLSDLNKLNAELPQRKEYRDFMDWKPRKSEGIKIRRCSYNYYKMIEYISQTNEKHEKPSANKVKRNDFFENRGSAFLPEETHVICYRNNVPAYLSYVDRHMHSIIDLCNGENTVDHIIRLLMDEYTDKYPRLSHVFGHCVFLIKSLIERGVIKIRERYLINK